MRATAFLILSVGAVTGAIEPATKPPKLPRVFITDVNVTTRNCFVQCNKGSKTDPCPKPGEGPNCPSPVEGLQQRMAYDFNNSRGWLQDSSTWATLQKNFTQISDVKAQNFYQLEPFAYPKQHDVCSGYPAYDLQMPHWTIAPNATIVGTAKVRGVECDHWRYEVKPGAPVPGMMAHYSYHVEDYWLLKGTNTPLKAHLDEKIVHADSEWTNFTEWNTEHHDYLTFEKLHDTSIFETASLNCKMMIASPSAGVKARKTPQQLHADSFWSTPLPRGFDPSANRRARTAVEASPYVQSDALIAQINAANSTWRAEPNPRFAGMTKAAFKKTLLRQPPRSFDGGVSASALLDAVDVPESFDVRKKYPKCVWPKTIIDQGTCGSCWAWAASGVMSTRLCMASNGTVNERLAPMWLLACNDKTDDGCGGGALDNVWTWLTTKGNGITSEKCNPYDPWGKYPTCEKKGSCTDQSVTDHTLFTATGRPWSPSGVPGSAQQVKAIQAEILKNGPVEVGISLFSDFAAYSKGIYQLTVNESYGGGHAVEIIGWGTEGGVDYWTVQNTYGKQWGENGYFRIRRGTNEIGIEQEVIAGTVVVPK